MACELFPETGLPSFCDSPFRISFSGAPLNLPPDSRTHGEDLDGVCTDFEFILAMANLDSVSADELFSNGKLLPLPLSPRSGTIHPQRLAPALKESPDSPKAPPPEAAIGQNLHLPESNLWVSPSAEGGLFAPPSPQPPKCSALLKDLLWVNKAQVGAIKEGPGKLPATRNLWKQLVRAVIASSKGGGGGALKSRILEENACKLKPPPPSSSSSSSSSSHTMARPPGRAGGAPCVDDLNLPLATKNASQVRCISMPASRCTSPGRESPQSIPHKTIPKELERSPPSSPRGVNSPKLIMKNLERCSTRLNLAPSSPNQFLTSIRSHQEVQSSPDKSIHGLQQRGCQKFHDKSIIAVQRKEYQRPHEKASPYSSNGRVTPVVNVPLNLVSSKTSNKFVKRRFSSLKELLSLKKETQF